MCVRVKLAILHSDPTYLNRLTAALEAKYRNRLLLYSFTSLEKAMEALGTEKIDVFLADDVFEIDMEALPEKCGWNYDLSRVLRRPEGHGPRWAYGGWRTGFHQPAEEWNQLIPAGW